MVKRYKWINLDNKLTVNETEIGFIPGSVLVYA